MKPLKTLITIFVLSIAAFAVPVYVPHEMAVPAGVFVVPIVAECDCIAADISLTFDNTIMWPKGEHFGCSAPNGWGFNCNLEGDTLLISTYSAYAGNVEIDVQFKGVPGASALNLSNVFVYDQTGWIPSEVQNGFLKIYN